VLRYDRRDVAVLAVDAAQAVELRARCAPHDRRCALRDQPVRGDRPEDLFRGDGWSW
jgi:hypothetical protein